MMRFCVAILRRQCFPLGRTSLFNSPHCLRIAVQPRGFHSSQSAASNGDSTSSISSADSGDTGNSPPVNLPKDDSVSIRKVTSKRARLLKYVGRTSVQKVLELQEQQEPKEHLQKAQPESRSQVQQTPPPTKKIEESQGSRVSLPHAQSALVDKSNDEANVQFRFNAPWLRDACTCSRCVDPSTKQKLFQTSDIPLDLKIATQSADSNGNFHITWTKDVPGYGIEHVSEYSCDFLSLHFKNDPAGYDFVESIRPVLWNKVIISDAVKFIDFNDYLTSDLALYNTLDQIRRYGLVFIKDVPDASSAVETIGGRIGNLRDTLYGRTWDVKSVPNAKNIAYTHQYLGFHMDLLYMANPPGLQLLHCLKNSCEGGNSLFSDSFQAVTDVAMQDRDLIKALNHFETTFHYQNSGHHYRHSHRIIPTANILSGDAFLTGKINFVNWSPPFQAPFQDAAARNFDKYLKAIKTLASRIEAPENIYEYRLKEGECVIFNNRRVLHARTAFDVTAGERWLKGAYLDTDVFRSRYRVLHESLSVSNAPSPAAVVV